MDRNRSVRIDRPGWFPMYYPPFIENGDASFLYLDVPGSLQEPNTQEPNMFPSLELFIQPTSRHKRKVATRPHNIQAQLIHTTLIPSSTTFSAKYPAPQGTPVEVVACLGHWPPNAAALAPSGPPIGQTVPGRTKNLSTSCQ